MQEHQSLRDRLAELDAVIPVLQKERKLIQKKLDALTYPVLQLPYDLTADIFLHCLPPIRYSASDHRTEHHITEPSAASAPLLLLKVCRTWRDIVLATPQLWASIQIYWRMADAPQQLQNWLTRASSCPLSLVLSHPEPPQDHSSKDMHTFEEFDEAFQRVLECSSRWYDVELFCKYDEFLGHASRFESALHGTLPTLERLKLNFTESWHHSHFSVLRFDYFDDPEPSWMRRLAMFEYAPKLRDLSIIHLPPSFLILPWAQLTTLLAENFSLSDCLQVLRLTSSLIDCSFGWITDPNRFDPPERTLDVLLDVPPLIFLDSLKIYGTYSARADILLPLTLPALTKLHRLPSDPETFLKFLSRSSAVLRELSMDRYYHTLMEGLPLMPALSVLSIHQVSLGEITHILRSLRDSPGFIPNLLSLDIHLDTPDRHRGWEWGHPQHLDDEDNTDSESHPEDLEDLEATFDYEALVDALSARWSQLNFTSVRLTKFSLTWLASRVSSPGRQSLITEEDIGLRPDPDILERLADLVDDGLQLYLGSQNKAWL
ncbi:hypothetical protein B0H19DRAFT_1169092 [Mycena capillaripes]|nr:hypothetical protein B0H19DRAFT_1169092 [Mycena capillaripes]